MNQSTNLKLDRHQNFAEFLKVTVETTRKTLKCDRVIIYDASELPVAEVIVESVDSVSDSILGKTITDPFLAGDYLEMYCYGQAVAIDNLDTANIDQNQLAELKKLKIKSLAIAPIFADNELLAFLVAHQCSRLQPWHSEAVNLLTEKANITGFALANIVKAGKSKDVNLTKQAIETQKQGNSQIMDGAKSENGNGNGNGNGKIKPTENTSIQENISSNSFADVIEKIDNYFDSYKSYYSNGNIKSEALSSWLGFA